MRKPCLASEAEIIQQKKPGDGSPTGNKHDFEELEERLAILSGKTGVFEVGGTTDVEIKERMVRIENAYMSAKAALEEGVLAGGGVGLFNIAPSLDEIIATNPEQQQDIAIQPLQRAFQSLLNNSNALLLLGVSRNNFI